LLDFCITTFVLGQIEEQHRADSFFGRVYLGWDDCSGKASAEIGHKGLRTLILYVPVSNKSS